MALWDLFSTNNVMVPGPNQMGPIKPLSAWERFTTPSKIYDSPADIPNAQGPNGTILNPTPQVSMADRMREGLKGGFANMMAVQPHAQPMQLHPMQSAQTGPSLSDYVQQMMRANRPGGGQ